MDDQESVMEQLVDIKSPNWSEPTSPIHIFPLWMKKTVSDNVNGGQWSDWVPIQSVVGPVMKQQVYVKKNIFDDNSMLLWMNRKV